MTTKLFSELGLSEDLLKAIEKLGFEKAAPIQAAAIPLLLQGADIVGQSQTGSGKTVAFAAPAIQKVNAEEPTTQILILCPTRELAVQVAEEVHKLALFRKGLRALPIFGGQSYERQFFGLRQGAHIVIGTPGRVIDHIHRGTLRLNSVKMVVLDEVDVMLNMGFREDIELILQNTNAERQTVFFSATIPKPIQVLIQKHSRDPQTVRIEQKAMTVPTVEQVYYEVDRYFKIELLTRLIDIHDLKLGIIFCNTRRMVDDVVEHLNAQGYSADRLHGEMTQAMRDRVMNRFRKSGLEFLVATDVAARGIDVENIEVVFNYDLPYDGEDYVHRIGRTGRQGRSGMAISFASGREVFQIRNIERYTNTRIHRARVPTLSEVETARENAVLDKVRTTLKSGEFKRQDHLVGRLLEEGFNSADIASALLHHLQTVDTGPAKADRSDFSLNRERDQRFPERSGSRAETQGGPVRRSHARDAATHRREAARTSDRAGTERSREQPSRIARKGEATGTPPPSPGVAQQSQRPALPMPKGFPARPRAASLPPAPRPPKPSRRTPGDKTRLFLSIGSQMGVSQEDVVNAILGHTGLARQSIGAVDLRERHVFVDVQSEHASGIVSKLNRTHIQGHKIKAKVA
jgi:ATP-dependent RNA helicase DeaD